MLSFHLTLSRTQRKVLNEALWVAEQSKSLGTCKRILAILSLDRGKSTVAQVAHTLQVSTEAVRSWLKGFLLRGVKALLPKPSKGRPPKLTEGQREELCDIIDQGPEKAGFTGGCWRSPMLVHLLQNRFRVSYSVKYLPQLLQRLGFTFQKARFVSDHLDEEKRKEWLQETFPKLLELAKSKGARLYFEDEVSFPQWGSLTYTWARKGKQPTIKTCGKRKGYKVFGMIEYFTGRFLYQCIEERFSSKTYQTFLQQVLQQTTEHLILVHDGAKYHRSKAMKAFYEQNKDRLTVVKLPSYSPDYNPIEKLWKKVKEKGTHLQYFPTFDDLKAKVQESLARFLDDKEEIFSLFEMYDKIALAD